MQIKMCECCGEEFPRRRGLSHKQWRTQRFCSRPCVVKARTKGWRTSNGYIELLVPGHPLATARGYVLEHRFVVYQAGISVPTGYHIHHKNGVKKDNQLENLEVVKAGDHGRLHAVARGAVTNQYGTFPVLTDEVDRRARNTRRCAAYQRRKRAAV